MASAGFGNRRTRVLKMSTFVLCCFLVNALGAREIKQPALLSTLDSLEGSHSCSPREVHLALSDNNGDIRASWRTRGPGCPSTVSFGIADSERSRLLGAPMRHSVGSSYTISEELMCDAPATKKPFTVNMHTAIMSDLKPGALYWYSLGNDDRLWTFRAPPRLGADEPFSFIAFGDMGESVIKARKIRMAAATVKAIEAEMDRSSVGLIVHVGDLAYADGKYMVWDSFMDQIEPLASRLPYMVGIGNHEAGPCRSGNDLDPSGEKPYMPEWGNYGSESGGECGAMAAHRFVMPGEEDLEKRGGAFAIAAAAAAGTKPLTAVAAKVPKGEPEAPSSAAHAGPGPAADNRRRLVSSEKGAEFLAAVASELEVAGTMSKEPGEEEPSENDYLKSGQGKGSGAAAADDVARTSAEVETAAAAVVDVQGPHSPYLASRRRVHNPPFWYSFDYGSVHFVMLSSEHDLERGSTQWSWLEADLAAVDRCRMPWVIVGLHRPMYVVYPHKDNRVVGEHIRASIEGLLLEFRVDLVVSGHVHTYYRSCSAAAGKCVADERDGIMHLVVGAAGHELSSVEDDQKDWCDELVHDWGFGRFDVDGDILHFSFIRSEDGRVADSVTLRAKVSPGRECAGRGIDLGLRVS